MVIFCKEEKFSDRPWWKDQCRANALTEVQAVDVKRVRLTHKELVWLHVATNAKCLTVDIGTNQDSCLQTQVLNVTKSLKPNQDVS